MVLMKKRQVLIVALSLVVVVAAYLNWTYTDEESDSVTVTGEIETKNYGEAELVDGEAEAEAVSTKGSGYFDSARVTRDKAKSDALETLREVAESDGASAEEKDKAFGSMRKSAENTEKEGNIENLLKAKGFSDALVYITDDTVSVTVKTDGLTTEDTAKIFDIVVGETGVSSEKIKIIEIK